MEKDDEEEADTRWGGEECSLVSRRERTVTPGFPIEKKKTLAKADREIAHPDSTRENE